MKPVLRVDQTLQWFHFRLKRLFLETLKRADYSATGNVTTQCCAIIKSARLSIIKFKSSFRKQIKKGVKAL